MSHWIHRKYIFTMEKCQMRRYGMDESSLDDGKGKHGDGLTQIWLTHHYILTHFTNELGTWEPPSLG